MGPDLGQMLERCDGALLIGDRALDEAARHPELVRMDLGEAWKDWTGFRWFSQSMLHVSMHQQDH